MSRLERLRAIRELIDAEIKTELGPRLPQGAEHPLVQAVARLYEVNPDHVVTGGRGHRVTRARHALAWLLHRDGMSHAEIADCLGYTDAGTVRYALRRITTHGVQALLLALPEVPQHPHLGAHTEPNEDP